MALDFLIVDLQPLQRVGLEEREHYELFEALRRSGRRFPSLSRLDDFYRDSHWDAQALAELRAELAMLREVPVSEGLATTLSRLDVLAELALRLGRTVVARAD